MVIIIGRDKPPRRIRQYMPCPCVYYINWGGLFLRNIVYNTQKHYISCSHLPERRRNYNTEKIISVVVLVLLRATITQIPRESSCNHRVAQMWRNLEDVSILICIHSARVYDSFFFFTLRADRGSLRRRTSFKLERLDYVVVVVVVA